MCVEFVFGSLLVSESFFSPVTLVPPSPQNSKFQIPIRYEKCLVSASLKNVHVYIKQHQRQMAPKNRAGDSVSLI